MDSNESSSTSSQTFSVNAKAGSKIRPKNKSETRQSDDGKSDASSNRNAVAPAAEEAASKGIERDREISKVQRRKSKKSKSKTSKKSSRAEEGNELSRLIPGYTAPMRLEAKSLEGIAGASLADLRRRAAREESVGRGPSISILKREEEAFDPAVEARKVKTPSSLALQKSAGAHIPKIPTSFASSFRKNPRRQHDNTAGSGWFGMEPTPMTDQLRTDLSMIRNRNYLDPKKFYKSADSFEGKVLQVGTVIEGSAEYYSARLARRDRRQNLTEEIMADAGVTGYAKRRFRELQTERERPRGKAGNKRGRTKR